MASWTTPTTHSTGDTLAVTDWNAVANNTTFLYEAPYAGYYNSVTTAIPSGTATQVTLGGTSFSGYGFSISSNNAIIPITGIYTVLYGGATNGPTSLGSVNLSSVYQNGTQRQQGNITPQTSGLNVTSSSAIIMSCAASDTVGLYLYQNSGSPLTSSITAQYTGLQLFFVGSA